MISLFFKKFIKLIKNTDTVRKYNSYREAFSDCFSNPYHDEELCRVIAIKTAVMAEKLKKMPLESNNSKNCLFFTISRILSEAPKKELNVVDFGGGCGLHFFETASFFKGEIVFKWIVVETQKMVCSARDQGLEKDGLSFISNIEGVNSAPDLLFSSGALQYVDDPEIYLNKLLSINSKYMLFSRMTLCSGLNNIYTIQQSMLSDNGPGSLPEGYKNRKIFCPHTTMSYQNFLDKILVDYEIDWEFDDGSGVHNIPGENIIGKGYLFKRKSYN